MNQHIFRSLALLLLVLSGVGCQRQKSDVPTTTNPLFTTLLRGLLRETVPLVSVNQLKAEPAPVLLDTRAAPEYAVSHLPGARWVGYDDFSLASVRDLPKNTPIVVYCSIGVRSEKVGEQLQKAGFSRVRNLYGGLFEWVNEGNVTVAAHDSVTTRVHAFSRTWGIWLQRGQKVY